MDGFRALRLIMSLLLVIDVSSSPSDKYAMYEVRNALKLPSIINWSDLDPCNWERVGCDNKRIIHIELAFQNVSGYLHPAISRLTNIRVLDLMGNYITGPLPSLKGLNSLEKLILRNNRFDYIPLNFLDGQRLLTELNLGKNPFRPWSIPNGFQTLAALTSFSAESANIVGRIPCFFNATTYPGLTNLYLSGNGLWGTLPEGFADLPLQTLRLNDQNVSDGAQALTGTIAVIGRMTGLVQVWLQGNAFTGPIPDLFRLDVLGQLYLSDNRLSGPVPPSLTNMKLNAISLANNFLQGPTPKFGPGVSVDMVGGNSFCLGKPGVDCDSRVDSLISIMEPFGYPLHIAEGWKGDDPCVFVGVTCSGGNISVINLQNMGLSGTLSPKFSSLTSVKVLILAHNNITGRIPNELTTMPNLLTLDVSYTRLDLSKMPSFPRTRVIVDGNIVTSQPRGTKGNGSSRIWVAIVVCVCIVLVLGLSIVHFRRRKLYPRTIRSDVVDNDGADPNIVVSGPAADVNTVTAGGPSDVHGLDISELVKSVQVLSRVTNDFSEDRILGKGGFGIVFLGELPDGIKIAVKRMESGVLGDQGLAEFQSEIDVLTKVRHRHLVDLLGSCVDGNEKFLVYEYMSQGTLSRHLFRWKDEGLKPLEWKQRLTISFDVARGVEYLHGLAQQCFIHRDLKPSNILLDDDMRAKVSDFGLARLVPNGGDTSFQTKQAGTFGYVAPECAEMGRVSVKVDVYSFGVILMQMITGLKALDESRSEDNVLLVSWFRKISNNEGTFQQAIDPVINLDEETLASVTVVSELARRCCVKEPRQRPEMSHVVNVISPLINKWNPPQDNNSAGVSGSGIDFGTSLPETLARWQANEDSIDDNMSRSLSGIVVELP